MAGPRLALALAPLLIALPAAAHHGWGGYEARNPLTLTGEIARVEFASPHATIWLQTPGRTWEVVLAPPSRMDSRGVSRDGLRAGMTVTVMGHPHRQRTEELRAEWIRIGETVTQMR